MSEHVRSLRPVIVPAMSGHYVRLLRRPCPHMSAHRVRPSCPPIAKQVDSQSFCALINMIYFFLTMKVEG